MKKFYLGMDIGTDSVGMACTDEKYDLLRAKGKDLWAVRLFDEANPAKDRRIKRTARRRLARRKQRIDFLQGVFAPFMDDDRFFIRLNNSGFYEEDKDEKLQTKFSLFADADYTDVEFYREYPTIFHLRKALIDGTAAKVDLRHYYLALHHIIKYRGHFLFEGEDVNAIRNVKNLFIELDEAVNRCFGYESELENLHWVDKANEFRALAMGNKGINDKKKAAIELFAATSPEHKELAALLIGSSVKPSVLFGEENAERFKEESSISFKKLNDESFEALQEVYDDDQFDLLAKARAIYNYVVFEKILDGSNYISDAMIAIYDKHHSDLIRLKKLIKATCSKDVYFKLFRSTTEKFNYCNYIGYTKNGAQKTYVDSKCSYDDFSKYLKKILTSDELKNNAEAQKIVEELTDGKFLAKILNADNGLFPHQINGMELHAILKNLCRDYPEFAVVGEDGYAPCDKINKIFLFKIPYYVGPLNGVDKGDGTRTNWVVKNSAEKITPWNFDDIVDKAQSSEGFIRRMTNKCSYLHTKDVLPKYSMYYQAFDVLNTINKLTIGVVPLTVEEKQAIFNDLYRVHKKVTAKNIENYLVMSGRYTKDELKESPLGGFDKETGLKPSLSSYVTIKKILEDLVDERPDIVENIILWHTLNTDKSIVEDAILKNYGDIPAIRDNIRSLKSLSGFKDFGRLSKELLTEIHAVNKETGEVCTFLGELYNTNYNFNQLLFLDTYTFNTEIESANRGESDEITDDDIDALYVSPMVKRGVKQAMKMTDEYVEAVGRVPDKIFIEVTRRDEEKKRTESRKDNLLKKYKEITDTTGRINSLVAELNKEETTDMRLRSERLYLYFLQLGKCVYSGELIDIEQLGTDLYDVDHIMPQSKTKDDSLDNKVLVKRTKNAEKGDTYPLSKGFSAQQSFWKLLKEKGLMSEKKYSLLTRTKPLDGNDFKAFVARQLVVTDQTAIAVKELLSKKYEKNGTKIVLSKAANVSDFKQKFDIIKCRETNDLHHARDAYFNVVVGNIYDTKFTSANDFYSKKQDDSWREYNLKYLYNKPIANAWNGIEDVPRIKSITAKTSMSVTRYSYTNHGALYNETVYDKNDGGIAVPRKECFPYNQTEKYGGFKSLNTAYFAIVESIGKKNKIQKTIEAIPVLVDYKAKNDPDAVNKYLLQKGLKEPKIIIPKLKIKSLVSVNGFKAWVAGATEGRIILHNANQWFTDAITDQYIKQATKFVSSEITKEASNKNKKDKEVVVKVYEENIPLMKNRKGVTLYATKEKNIEIYDRVIERLKKSSYQGLSAVKSFGEKLQSKKTLFTSLSTFDQLKVILQVVQFMKCNASLSDLSLLKDGANCGLIRINKDITDVDFAIIHQSPCGLKERVQKV